MTYLDAAYAILKAAGQPLHYEEITERALDQKLIAPQGLTPEATMGSRLYTDTLQEGSRFVRAGKGSFGNQRARSVLRIVERLLAALGHRPEAFEIEMAG